MQTHRLMREMSVKKKKKSLQKTMQTLPHVDKRLPVLVFDGLDSLFLPNNGNE